MKALTSSVEFCAISDKYNTNNQFLVTLEVATTVSGYLLKLNSTVCIICNRKACIHSASTMQLLTNIIKWVQY